jgi:hypothetical protein
VLYKCSQFKSIRSLLYRALLMSTFRLILCSHDHYQSSGCVPLCPAVEHLTHVGRNIVPLDSDSASLLCHLPPMHQSYRQIDMPVFL